MGAFCGTGGLLGVRTTVEYGNWRGTYSRSEVDFRRGSGAGAYRDAPGAPTCLVKAEDQGVGVVEGGLSRRWCAWVVARCRSSSRVTRRWCCRPRLERLQMRDISRLVNDPAVWAPVHRIAGTLDKVLPELLASDYGRQLEAARQRLRPED